MAANTTDHGRGERGKTRARSKEIRSHKDLRVWRKAQRLGDLCREAAAGFPPDQETLAGRISRLAHEVPDEIATGQAQRCYEAYVEHLQRSRRAVLHLERRLIEAHQSGVLPAAVGDPLLARVAEIARMLGKLMVSLEVAHARRHAEGP